METKNYDNFQEHLFNVGKESHDIIKLSEFFPTGVFFASKHFIGTIKPSSFNFPICFL